MKEMLYALRTCWQEHMRAAVATIIQAEGSVYRRAGASCVIFEDGTIGGVISGGCVEKDLYEYAVDVMDNGSARVIDYDFRSDDDMVWGLNLGCNGALAVWLQPFNPKTDPLAAQRILSELERRHDCQTSYKFGTVISSSDEQMVSAGATFDLPEDFSVGFQDTAIRQTDVQLFVEHVLPNEHLVIFGAGPDVNPLVHIAKWLDWHVTLVDHREDWANSRRFPEADKIQIVDRKDYSSVQISEQSFVVIMTHNYDLDKAVLQGLIEKNMRYIGVLGPRKRTVRLLEGLVTESNLSDLSDFPDVHSPVGLDIGSESPEEIALSIVSEMMCRKTGRAGGFLKNRAGSIHMDASPAANLK